jgi:3-demethylubiquinone-9 3-methyltransferase
MSQKIQAAGSGDAVETQVDRSSFVRPRRSVPTPWVSGRLLGSPIAKDDDMQKITPFLWFDDQAEVDELWDRLSEGGEKGPCGWLKDGFGVSWQIIPSVLMELVSDPDADRSKRVMEAIRRMGRIDVAELESAHAG